MPISRRDFLKSGAAAIAGFTIAPSSILGKSHGHISPTDKLNIGVVGIGGIGHSNINAVKDTENIVAHHHRRCHDARQTCILPEASYTLGV